MSTTKIIEKFEETALRMEAEIRAKGLMPDIRYSVTRVLFGRTLFYIGVSGKTLDGDEPVRLSQSCFSGNFANMLMETEKELAEQLSTL